MTAPLLPLQRVARRCAVHRCHRIDLALQRQIPRGTLGPNGRISNTSRLHGTRAYHASRASKAAPVTASPLSDSNGPSASHDVIIIGSGAGALTAALRLKAGGLKPLVIEKTGFVGGCSGYSGGGLWIPNSGVHDAAQTQDSKAKALEYLSHLIQKEAGAASSPARRNAFLDNGPKMVGFLASQGFQWVPSVEYPDYYPNLPGGMPEGGRSIETRLFDLNELGEHKRLMINAPLKMGMYTHEARYAARMGMTWDSVKVLWRVFAERALGGRIRGKDYVGMGQALVGRLLQLNLKAGNEIWVDCAMKKLVVDDEGNVIGVVAQKNGEDVQLIARRGVVIAAGGFSQDAALRGKHQGASMTSDWTSTPLGDTGEAITAAATDAGAHLVNMHQAWWGPTMVNPRTKQRLWEMNSRCYPHGIIVDQAGQRFSNESQGYVAFGEDQIARHKTTPAIPAALIVDSQHRSRYPFAGQPPGFLGSTLKDSLVFKADTLAELAGKMNISAPGLEQQVASFNADVAKGVDTQYQRGDSAYDGYFGDPAYPNPCLGTIAKAPFYGAYIWPGDLGTSGGILTDEHARALREDGSIIGGLYATGNSTASVMGGYYPGSGATLGPALTFGFVAAEHIAG